MNAFKKCPQCQKEVDIKASRCPFCQGKIYIWTRGRKLMLVLISLVVITIVISSNSSTSTPITSAQQISGIKLQSARILAKSYIEAIPLKSPSTAKYNPPTTKVDPQNPNLYEVSSYIDSQNGFGAMIRTYWSMKLQFIGEENQTSIETDSNWKIKEFIFDGNKIM